MQAAAISLIYLPNMQYFQELTMQQQPMTSGERIEEHILMDNRLLRVEHLKLSINERFPPSVDSLSRSVKKKTTPQNSRG